ncbi:MAG: 2,3-bisphosphoglycerate-independent phosphoglycerate mutase [Proteobacteria bacterium]|nr:2,3-bisphosphoglycerate-independent phosphoglycerate mutase [Pseudomonadota bacterium]
MLPVYLIILDGWGINNSLKTKNAFRSANAPFIKSLFEKYPHSQLSASGEDVGLPDGQMGNSEVGHLNIGAGRIVYQDLTRISKEIKNGNFFKNPVLNKAFEIAKKHESKVHLMGLVSDGGVHSHIDHLKGLLELAKIKDFRNVVIHCFTDGRDTPPTNGIEYIKDLSNHLSNLGFGRIGVVSGRYYAMDRDKRWDRTKLAYDALTLGEAPYYAESAVEAVKMAYDRGETDEFIKPTIVKQDQDIRITKKDVVIFFNFRADRARQLTKALTEEKFNDFERKVQPDISYYVTMTLYDELFKNVHIAFPPESLKNILGEVLSEHKIRQLRIAETEKYAHVTYFFNGGEEKAFPYEDRCLIPSPREVPTYDLKPEMSAYEVTDEVIKRLNSETYEFVVLNYANMDMVGHTGVFESAVKAVEALDNCLSRLIPAILEKNGTIFLTSDHGNAEQMTEEDGSPHTAHTTNPVPFIFISNGSKLKVRNGILADIAPTILSFMGIKKPNEMTGVSLFQTD